MGVHDPVNDLGPARPPVFRRVLVAADESEQAGWAIDIGAQLARATGAKLAIVHVYAAPAYSAVTTVPLMEIEVSARTAAQITLQALCNNLPGGISCDALLQEGRPAERILETARDWRADLVVLGTRGRGRLGAFLLGSTAEAVMRRATCPVLTIAHKPPGEFGIGLGAEAGFATTPPAQAATGSASPFTQ
jgi:nucleotide-binding universal stress UspA family protein